MPIESKPECVDDSQQNGKCENVCCKQTQVLMMAHAGMPIASIPECTDGPCQQLATRVELRSACCWKPKFVDSAPPASNSKQRKVQGSILQLN